jgi:hypothetical protein
MGLRAICGYQRIFAVRAARREDCLTADVPTSAAPKSSLCLDREARKDGPTRPITALVLNVCFCEEQTWSSSAPSDRIAEFSAVHLDASEELVTEKSARYRLTAEQKRSPKRTCDASKPSAAAFHAGSWCVAAP